MWIMAIFYGHKSDSVSKGIQLILERFALREEKVSEFVGEGQLRTKISWYLCPHLVVFWC
jgi:hypothetical protein